MAHKYTIDCPKCKAIVLVMERPLGGAGSKYMEETHCPNCGEFLNKHMTTGSIDTRIVNGNLKEDDH